MVWHNNMFINSYVIVEILHMLQLIPYNLTLLGESDFRTVREAGPYDVAKKLLLFFRADGDEVITWSIIIIVGQTCGLPFW